MWNAKSCLVVLLGLFAFEETYAWSILVGKTGLFNCGQCLHQKGLFRNDNSFSRVKRCRAQGLRLSRQSLNTVAAALAEDNKQHKDPWIAPLEREVEELDRRLFKAPWEVVAHDPSVQKVFDYGLIKTQGPLGNEAKSLCKAMAELHYVVVRLPEEDMPIIEGMWRSARRFLDLEESKRQDAAGSFRKLDGMVGILGYSMMPDGNCFLEMRVDHRGQLLPESLENSLGQEFARGVVQCRQLLTNISTQVLCAAAAHANINFKGLLSLCEDGSGLPEGKISSTQHRLCHYTAETDVPFEAHTDTTFFTLIPRASVSGLEVFANDTQWVCPDGTHLPEGEDGSRQVIIMPGEILQLLTGGVFKASIHRVTRTQAARPRTSMPLLVRGRMQETIKTSALVPSAASMHDHDAYNKISMLDGAELGQIHAFLSNPPVDRK